MGPQGRCTLSRRYPAPCQASAVASRHREDCTGGFAIRNLAAALHCAPAARIRKKDVKRIVLFVLTNLAVMIVLSIVVRVFGLDQALEANGTQPRRLIGLFGSGGICRRDHLAPDVEVDCQVVDRRASDRQSRDESQAWLLAAVKRLADKAGISMPEVAVYEGEPNAFATGAFRNSALVAVSSGLLSSMSREELEAVLGHEIAHVANGDMVTMTLIQGVLNTFVVFLARAGGVLRRQARLSHRTRHRPRYFITILVCQIVFGVLAAIVVAWFSRRREFRADAGSALYLGSPQPMMRALARLGVCRRESYPNR